LDPADSERTRPTDPRAPLLERGGLWARDPAARLSAVGSPVFLIPTGPKETELRLQRGQTQTVSSSTSKRLSKKLAVEWFLLSSRFHPLADGAG